jgi:hypothetical protein
MPPLARPAGTSPISKRQVAPQNLRDRGRDRRILRIGRDRPHRYERPLRYVVATDQLDAGRDARGVLCLGCSCQREQHRCHQVLNAENAEGAESLVATQDNFVAQF